MGDTTAALFLLHRPMGVCLKRPVPPTPTPECCAGKPWLQEDCLQDGVAPVHTGLKVPGPYKCSKRLDHSGDLVADTLGCQGPKQTP